MSPIVLSYSVYSGVATVLTVGLARTLSRHGQVFLEDVFPDRPTLARSINQLLVVGFFMLNLGYAFFLMRQTNPANGQAAFEGLAQRLGVLLVSLAGIHFVNVMVFWKIRRSQKLRELAPPIVPSMRIPPTINPATINPATINPATA
jgi:hypothetical protein